MRRDALRAVCSAGLFGLKLRDRRFFKIYIDKIKTKSFKTLKRHFEAFKIFRKRIKIFASKVTMMNTKSL